MAFRVLLIDNYDSYTYSLHHLIATACGAEPLTISNDAFASWAELRSALPPFDAVVISPGPGRPDTPGDFGVCAEAIVSGLPVFGVCLGHQGIALAFGGRVVRAAPSARVRSVPLYPYLHRCSLHNCAATAPLRFDLQRLSLQVRGAEPMHGRVSAVQRERQRPSNPAPLQPGP